MNGTISDAAERLLFQIKKIEESLFACTSEEFDRNRIAIKFMEADLTRMVPSLIAENKKMKRALERIVNTDCSDCSAKIIAGKGLEVG